MANKKNGADVAQPFPSIERRVSLESLEDRMTNPRPTESPYTSDNVDVVFGKRAKPFRVPKALLQKCSNLPDLVSDTLRLENIPEKAGHVLIHHLYTRTFQCLAPQGITDRERHSDEFVTCIEAYKAALHYNLATLAEQSQGEIERLGEALTVPEILALLTKAYPNPDVDDVWISNYLKTQLNAEALRNIERPDTVPEPDAVEVAHDPNMEVDSESEIMTPPWSSWNSSVDAPSSFEYANEVAATDRGIESSTNIEIKTKINKRKRNRKRGKKVRNIMKIESEVFGSDKS
ncbi:hypothetical protein SUNI508_09424 [Seiridium unicorne]|uniref:Uncharacterized protein n=1 Tax=Seiridium unicorne TaxID=138068 RepID=A0ABR2UR10_9PEZI